MRRTLIFMPLICGIVLAAGVVLGSFLQPRNMPDNGGAVTDANSAYDKIRAVLGFVQKNYVDSVDANALTDKTLVSMLQNLDPHSDYFTAEQIKAMNEPLQGNFEGIGIEYNFIRDTLVVMTVIPGGPSEKAGLQPGDRIIRANDTSLVGKNATEEFIKNKLRGPSDTKVSVTIKRPSQAKLLGITITRGSIPIFSVESSYMIDKETGYVRLVRFSETSYDEFVKATDTLLAQGMKKLVLDLRGNGGGLLDAATSIADEFLPEGKMIVYTRGRTDGEDKIRATKKGKLEKMPLAILVDEYSASASEILTGAIQDNDRGIIVGRRTFGKGLVQEEQQLSDGSAFRLTIARYYTPTGRCIQKPYDKGIEAYDNEEEQRYKHGELLNRDSIHFPDSLKYKTPAGKIVYGGGGIMPDVFVPLDTAGGSVFLNDLFYKNILTIWSQNYALKHKDALMHAGIEQYRASFEITDAMLGDLLAVAAANGVQKNTSQLHRSDPVIRRYMKAYVARSIWGNNGYFQSWNDGDKMIIAALDALKK